MASIITRRGLLTGGAAFMGAAALAPIVASANEIEWTGEADIVAVGAGGAGLSCAIEGRDLGLSVIVLEAMSMVGGSSRLCNGGIAIPGTPLQEEQGVEDSPELFAQDLIQYTAEDNNHEWLTLHAELAAGLWPWLTGLGVEFKSEGLLPSQGHSAPREHHVTPTVVIEVLEGAALERGAEIICDTRASRLIKDENGRVIGVSAINEAGEEVCYKANLGVVLATNGYSRDAEMMNQYIFGLGAENIIAFSNPGDRGDGHRMALSVGAKARHMGYISLLAGQHPDGMPGQSCSMMNSGAIMVNANGERFIDESVGYSNVWETLVSQPGGYSWQIWDNDLAKKNADNESSLYSMAKFRSYDGLLIEADTFEELAEACDLPVDVLVATVEQYNADIDQTGVDSVFGRAHLVSGIGEPLKCETAPFYAWKTAVVNYGTTGGFEVNLDQQMIDVFGDPIPGLYCAGTICTYAQMGIKPGTLRQVGASGTGFGGSMAWGRYVAQRIAELEA